METKVLKYAKDLDFGCKMISDDEAICDYLVDRHGASIMRSFDQRPENTGVAIFFFEKDVYQDLVVVMRMKDFEDGGNGLIMFFIPEVNTNKDAAQKFREVINISFESNTKLRDEVLISIEEHIHKATQYQFNA